MLFAKRLINVIVNGSDNDRELRNVNKPDEDILEFFVQHYFALPSPCHGIFYLNLVQHKHTKIYRDIPKTACKFKMI